MHSNKRRCEVYIQLISNGMQHNNFISCILTRKGVYIRLYRTIHNRTKNNNNIEEWVNNEEEGERERGLNWTYNMIK